MTPISRVGLASIALAGLSSPAGATELYSLTATLLGPSGPIESGTRSFGTANALLDSFTDGALDNILPGYTSHSITQANIDFQNLNFFVEFPTSGTMLVFKVPELGITLDFDGATRGKSVTLLTNFLKHDGGAILERIQKALIKSSPVSPVAGNPNSLQSNVVANDFFVGGGSPAPGAPVVPVGPRSQDNRLFLGLSAGTFSANGVSGETFTLPLYYTLHFVDDPRYQLNLSLPLTYYTANGAQGGSGALGVGFQFPLSDSWYLTPRISYGIAASSDLASAAQLISGTLTSRYLFELENGFFGLPAEYTLANLIGYSSTLGLQTAGYNFNPSTQEFVTKNGVMVEIPLPFELVGEQASVQGSYAYTHFFGTALYMQGYHEIDLTIGTLSNDRSSILNLLRLGVGATFGPGFSQYSVSFGYTF